jgi:2-oxo-4-hydroxy-4-carboxy-5-ureidoimidazoline decarboxylase
MVSERPFPSVGKVFDAAGRIWNALSQADWKEAFSHHPRIGDLKGLRQKFATTANWASKEQAGVDGASDELLSGLAEKNRLYEEKFGYIFIVCATGKSAGEMLALVSERMKNEPGAEIRLAAAEQAKITKLRLEKLFATGAS